MQTSHQHCSAVFICMLSCHFYKKVFSPEGHLIKNRFFVSGIKVVPTINSF